ncbi:hypothetical protein F4811DRAFT_572199 [Daldinia bambusicola]|nr:hypothetical protein F4811DRAFT_572199 [Daldinia bambusicola]
MAYESESAKKFYYLYHHWTAEKAARMLTPHFSLNDLAMAISEPNPPDVTISMPEENRSWSVHSNTVSSHSNFFRIALTAPFAESQSKVVKLYELDPDLVDFFVNYMYNLDFDTAARRTWGVFGDEVPAETTAGILLAADYLDAPMLMYRAYRTLVSGMARLARRSQMQPPYEPESRRIRRDFLHAADLLEESGTRVGRDVGKDMRTLMDKLESVGNFVEARNAFMEVFPAEDTVADEELS